MENAVSDGYLKLSPDGQHFTATLKGAYMMTWAQIPPFKYLVVANTKRQSKSRLARAGFAE